MKMAELKGNKTRLTLNLSFFTSNDQNNNNYPTKSPAANNNKSPNPKNFEEPNGVVGLGIVAALNESNHNTHDPVFISAKSSRAAIFAVSPRSNPIPIFSKSIVTPNSVELSEEYTCVISHIGENLIQKREYFDGELGSLSKTSTTTTSYWVSSGGVFSASTSPAVIGPVFQSGDFLSSCYLCKKKLHGLDIFMYRGEKAFCSAECRCKHISVDEHKDKYTSGVRKPHEYSVSPCSGPMQFLAGVAAA